MNYQEIFKSQLTATNSIPETNIFSGDLMIISGIPLRNSLIDPRAKYLNDHRGEKKVFYLVRDYTKSPVQVKLLSIVESHFSELDLYTFTGKYCHQDDGLKNIPEFEIR